MIFLSPPPLLLKQKAASISRLNRDPFFTRTENRSRFGSISLTYIILPCNIPMLKTNVLCYVANKVKYNMRESGKEKS